MIKLKGYEFKYLYEMNGLKVKTPNGEIFIMNCEGLAETAIASSIQHYKFYKDLYAKQLLENGVNIIEAAKEACELDDIVKKMKEDFK